MTPASVWECVPALQTESEQAAALAKRALACYRKYHSNGDFNNSQMQSLADSLWQLERLNDVEEVDRLTIDLARYYAGPDHLYTIQLQSNLACSLWSQGRYSESEALEVDVLNRSLTILDDDDEDILVYKANLSCTYREQGNFQAAEQLSREVVEKATVSLGERHANTISFKQNLAKTYWLMHQWEKARVLLEEVVERRMELFGPRHKSTLHSCNALVTTLLSLGQRDRAADLMNEIQLILLSYASPPTLLWTFEYLDNHGEQLYHLDQDSEAESIFRELVRRRTQKLSAHHPDTMSSMEWLAATLFAQAKEIEAQTVSQQVVKLMTEVLGPKHPKTMCALSSLTCYMSSCKSMKELESTMERLVSSQTELLGIYHPDTLYCLSAKAWIELEHGNLATAEITYRKVREVQHKLYHGNDHPDVIKSSIELGNTLRYRENYTESETILRDAHRRSVSVFGEKGIETCRIERQLINLLIVQEKFDEAENLIELSLAQHSGIFGSRHPLTIKVLLRRAELRGCQNRWAEAESIYRQALEYEQHRDKDSPRLHDLMDDLAESCAEQGKHAEASQLSSKALETLRDGCGNSNTRVRELLFSIARRCRQANQWMQAAEAQQECLKIEEALRGPLHSATLRQAMDMGKIYSCMKRYNDSAKFYERAYHGYDQTVGSNHPDTILASLQLAHQLFNQQQWMPAIEIYRDVLAKRTSILGVGHADTISVKMDLANALIKGNVFHEAGEIVNETLSSLRESGSPENHLEYHVVLRRSAKAMYELKHYDEAVLLQRQLLSLIEEHESVKVALMQLGVYLISAGQLCHAEEVEQQALEIWRQHSNCDSADFATHLYNLAYTKHKVGKLDEAESLLTEWDQLIPRLGLETSNYIASGISLLSRVKASLGKYQEAEMLQRQAVNHYKEIAGEDSEEYITSLDRLVTYLIDSKKWVESREAAVLSMECRKAISGEENAEYLEKILFLARINMFLKHFEEAQTLLLRQLDYLEPCRLTWADQYLRTLVLLGRTYAAADKPSEAQKMLSKAQVEALGLLDNKSTEYWSVLKSLARAEYKLGRLNEAESLYTMILDHAQLNMPPQGIIDFDCHLSLAVTKKDLGKHEEAIELLGQCVELSAKSPAETSPTLEELQDLLSEMEIEVRDEGT
jgi:hypothetical protein